MISYLDSLSLAMTELGKLPNSVFIGQSVLFDGTGMHKSFINIPNTKKIEFPVAEEMQLGASIGLALNKFLPITVFPRINFMMRTMDALVNHLDKLPIQRYGNGFAPKVIIRTAVATNNPLDPGPQHLGDYSNALQSMLSTVKVWRLRTPGDVLELYRAAVLADHSTVLVEYHELYGT